uniref:Uncharacterized protein n=1 Tax=Arundo donax TaxID=35708 RepID=A0A0A9ACA2_ARUDO
MANFLFLNCCFLISSICFLFNSCLFCMIGGISHFDVSVRYFVDDTRVALVHLFFLNFVVTCISAIVG